MSVEGVDALASDNPQINTLITGICLCRITKWQEEEWNSKFMNYCWVCKQGNNLQKNQYWHSFNLFKRPRGTFALWYWFFCQYFETACVGFDLAGFLTRFTVCVVDIICWAWFTLACICSTLFWFRWCHLLRASFFLCRVLTLLWFRESIWSALHFLAVYTAATAAIVSTVMTAMTIRATVPPVNLKLVVLLEAVVPPVNLKLVVLLEAVLEDTKKQGRYHVWCQVPVTFMLVNRCKGP